MENERNLLRIRNPDNFKKHVMVDYFMAGCHSRNLDIFAQNTVGAID
jgi:hypothetical protein